MNDYEARQEAKRERYQELAEKSRARSAALSKEANTMLDAIPFGQPILIGHHSERRDRNFRDRIHNKFGQAVEADKKAAYYEGKAANVGKGGVSSDDPEAADKLKAKLADLETSQTTMKAANKIVRKQPRDKFTTPKLKELIGLGLPEAAARELFEAGFCGRIGFPDYVLQNNNANIRRIRQRIQYLESLRTAESSERQIGDIKIVEDADDNRIRLIFPGKPDEATRQTLKQYGFRWSRYNQAWQRMLNNAGRHAAQAVIKTLNPEGES